MDKKTIQKSIEIKASKEKVWEILTKQPYLNDWTSAFMKGSEVRGEIKEGNQILYVDTTSNNMGVVGKVTEFKSNNTLRINILAGVTNGKPDFDNPDSKKWEGTYDHYQLSENNAVTTLSMETAFPDEFFEDFVPGWNKMLDRIKELAEK